MSKLVLLFFLNFVSVICLFIGIFFILFVGFGLGILVMHLFLSILIILGFLLPMVFWGSQDVKSSLKSFFTLYAISEFLCEFLFMFGYINKLPFLCIFLILFKTGLFPFIFYIPFVSSILVLNFSYLSISFFLFLFLNKIWAYALILVMPISMYCLLFFISFTLLYLLFGFNGDSFDFYSSLMVFESVSMVVVFMCFPEFSVCMYLVYSFIFQVSSVGGINNDEKGGSFFNLLCLAALSGVPIFPMFFFKFYCLLFFVDFSTFLLVLFILVYFKYFGFFLFYFVFSSWKEGLKFLFKLFLFYFVLIVFCFCFFVLFVSSFVFMIL